MFWNYDLNLKKNKNSWNQKAVPLFFFPIFLFQV